MLAFLPKPEAPDSSACAAWGLSPKAPEVFALLAGGSMYSHERVRSGRARGFTITGMPGKCRSSMKAVAFLDLAPGTLKSTWRDGLRAYLSDTPSRGFSLAPLPWLKHHLRTALARARCAPRLSISSIRSNETTCGGKAAPALQAGHGVFIIVTLVVEGISCLSGSSRASDC